ncbi:MAG: ABC-2 family transporter protein [bacterium]|nr:ABC-2 family transporter protein [bacterium]
MDANPWRFPPAARRGPWSRFTWQLGIYGAYFAQFVKSRLAYRVDFFIDTLAISFSILVQMAVLTALFAKVKALQGWSFEEVLFIYGFSLVPLGLFNLISVNLYRFGDDYIVQGKLDRVLLRPVGTLTQVLCESFNVSGLNEIVLGTAVMIYAGMELGLTLGVDDVLGLAVLGPAAALIYTGVFLAITSVTFWAEDRMGLAPPVYNVIRFSRYPMTIYSLPVRIFLTFVLPFAWVAFYPATWFLGSPGFKHLALLTPGVGLIVFGGAVAIWKKGIRRYASTGS